MPGFTPVQVQEFDTMWLVLKSEIKQFLKENKMAPEVLDRLDWSLDTNTLSGRRSRGLQVPNSARALVGSTSSLSEEQERDLTILGWLIQLQSSYVFLCDDIIDGSLLRRGEPTWWSRPEIGKTAVNDAFLINFCIYFLLKKHFKHHPAYTTLFELFQESSFLTEAGQAGDHLVGGDPGNFDKFTMTKYEQVVKGKTGHYICLPVLIALTYLQLATPKNVAQTCDTLMAISYFLQVQDDYLDVFGDPAITGKIGTDIQENKCSWLIVQALERCTPDQRKVLERCYGQPSDHLAEEVKQIFRRLKLDQVYKEYEEQALIGLTEMVESIDETEGLKKEVFSMFGSEYQIISN
ncbi:hypothetical protein IFM61606_06193 [Aspergillus udagawae]|uniref:Farnesyl pyrophosphate synthase n=1 Tax=Aspergillus udagawae TaxID=91492 RepID=A0ABQ1B3N5_9EURO|nr:hypothetical protein IFM51744_07394 [Aspergillus udagawae]GFF93133.1 hypothetical protein IFM53868_07085 [Aspergillus udagawae]GFG09360.1 hypothetical protein IFM5058_04383 [Aspergillus udagawae]GFG26221.1 hypothetical protein IFM61606_06193 [Aspergillus udagawae]